MTDQTVIFYGTTWCADCTRSKKILDENHITYNYINIDTNKHAAKEVEKINNGYRSVPTIIFPNGKTLTEPTNAQLLQALKTESS